LVARGKPKPQVVVVVARELLGFGWVISIQAERDSKLVMVSAALGHDCSLWPTGGKAT
jgi:hypothetical protein